MSNVNEDDKEIDKCHECNHLNCFMMSRGVVNNVEPDAEKSFGNLSNVMLHLQYFIGLSIEN